VDVEGGDGGGDSSEADGISKVGITDVVVLNVEGFSGVEAVGVGDGEAGSLAPLSAGSVTDSSSPVRLSKKPSFGPSNQPSMTSFPVPDSGNTLS